jgi:hypothetical protein
MSDPNDKRIEVLDPDDPRRVDISQYEDGEYHQDEQQRHEEYNDDIGFNERFDRVWKPR